MPVPVTSLLRRFTLSLLLLLPVAGRSLAEQTTVQVAPLGDLLQQRLLDNRADVVALNQPVIAARIASLIEEIPVHVGQRVSRGELLARLDCRHYRQQQQAAEAQLQELSSRRDFAARQLQRASDLKRKKSISEELLDQRRADLDSLRAQIAGQRAQIAQAGLQVEFCELRAPFEAEVVARFAAEGSLAQPGTPLLEVRQLGAAELSALLRDSDWRSFEQAEDYWFSYQRQTYPLRLAFASAAIDRRSQTRELRFLFPAQTPPAGASGRLQWHSSDGQLGVFWVDSDDNARFAALPTAQEGQPVAIGLPADTRLVVSGQQRLQDGARVILQDAASNGRERP